MEKYRFVKEKLRDIDVNLSDKLFITDEELVEEYKSLSSSGKDLPKGVKEEKYRRIKSNGDMFTDVRFYKDTNLQDEHIKALLEVKQTKALMSIAASMKFFVVITVLSLLFGYLLSLLG